MTTIAFCDGIMAADSQETNEDDTCELNVTKLFKLKSGGIFGCAGESDCREILILFDNVIKEKDIPLRSEIIDLEIDFTGLLYLPNQTLWYIKICFNEDLAKWSGEATKLKTDFTAIGTGRQFAIGAMEKGANAKQAVEIASYYDIYTGGPIKTMTLNIKRKKNNGKK